MIHHKDEAARLASDFAGTDEMNLEGQLVICEPVSPIRRPTELEESANFHAAFGMLVSLHNHLSVYCR